MEEGGEAEVGGLSALWLDVEFGRGWWSRRCGDGATSYAHERGVEGGEQRRGLLVLAVEPATARATATAITWIRWEERD
jgi:hypothetical protein